MICAASTTTSAVLFNRFDGIKWAGFLTSVSTTTADTTCTPLGISGQVGCFVRSLDSALYGDLYKGGAWSLTQWGGWGGLGGISNPKLSCTTIGTGQLACGVVAVTDSALYVDQFTGTAWTGFVKLGGIQIGSPSCASLGIGKAICVVVGVANTATSTVGP